MSDFLYLVPLALLLGLAGLAAFMWTLRTGQYEDLDGAAERILDAHEDVPASARSRDPRRQNAQPDAAGRDAAAARSGQSVDP
jgi:cbb3-type cytochrome oxidase maturation protein